MKKHLEKNRDFFNNFCFIQSLLKSPKQYGIGLMNVDGLKDKDELFIEYREADKNLMLRYGQNIDPPYYNGYSHNTNLEIKNQVGAQEEILLSLDYEGNLVDILQWPKNNSLLGMHFLAREIFWRKSTNGKVYHTLRRVSHLVWITIQEWYQKKEGEVNKKSPFGKLQQRLIKITVYSKPQEGFKNLYQSTL